MIPPKLLEVDGLCVGFKTRTGEVGVLQDVTFTVAEGETLCLVGESGSGKSLTALAIMGLLPAPNGVIRRGSIRLAGEELVRADPARLRQVRGKEIAMVFQEPMTALNPVYSIGEQIAEVVRLHDGLGRKAAWDHAIEMLRAVGIPVPQQRVREFPHQLSGGMRQRAMIAIALACRPQILLADEPTTSLDVTVQAQILDLLRDIQQRFGTSLILITHDMSVVSEMADRVIVMYAGRKVEEGRAVDVLQQAAHPYTRALIDCIPRLSADAIDGNPLHEIPGVVPLFARPFRGCAFAPRCISAQPRCRSEPPPIMSVDPNHLAACWLFDHTEAVR